MANARSSVIKSERGRSCLEGGGVVASASWAVGLEVLQGSGMPSGTRVCSILRGKARFDPKLC